MLLKKKKARCAKVKPEKKMMGEKSESSEKLAGTLIPKPSGIKPPAAVPKVSRMCEHHDKKPDLPTAATPSKTSE